jgi:hypothetical protein
MTRSLLLLLCASFAACPKEEGPDTVIGTQLVAQAGLKLQDSSLDGSLLAYTDAIETLFVISTSGGAPIEIASNIDRARFRGGFLLAFSGVSSDEKTAANMLAFRQGETTPAFSGARVVLESLEESTDGLHLYFEANQVADPTLEDLFLDGQLLLSGVQNARGRFSPANDLLLLSNTNPDATSALNAFPVEGGVAIPLATGNSNRFQITSDGAQILFGANEAGPIADLSLLASSGGGAPTQVVAQVNDDGFRLLKDNASLAFINLAGGLESIALDGTGRLELVPSGVIETEDASTNAIVYITNFDLVTGLPSLRMARADGSLDLNLGTLAVSEGFSPDNVFYFFRDTMRTDPTTLEPKDGTLRFVNTTTGALSTLAVDVKKVSVPDNTRTIFLTRNDLLQLADVATGERQVLQDFVDRFDLVRSPAATQVAFSIKEGELAGLYLADF